MFRLFIYLSLLVPFILFAEERIFVSLENEAGKAINKIHYIVSGSRQGIIIKDNLKISFFQLIIPGRDFFLLRENLKNG